jgi:thioredoxin-dependent peroxiredoxin
MLALLALGKNQLAVCDRCFGLVSTNSDPITSARHDSWRPGNVCYVTIWAHPFYTRSAVLDVTCTRKDVPTMAFLERALSAVGLRPRSQVAVGQPAPDFTLFDSEGQAVSLGELIKQGPVLLAFYPRAFTSGCTHELRSYATQQAELSAKGAQLCAISVDDRETLARFRASLGATFRFLSDPDGEVSRQYGGVSGGTANRITVTVGQDGRVSRITSGLSAIFPGADIESCPIGR